MARSLRLVLCLSSIAMAESGSLRGRALAEGASSRIRDAPPSLDGSLRWKVQSQPDQTFSKSSENLLEEVATTTDVTVAPLTTSVNVNSSEGQPSSPEVASAPTEEAPRPEAKSFDVDQPFEVHTMLLWALRTATGKAGEIHPDYHQQSATEHLGLEVTEKCVPRAAQLLWSEHFTSAVNMMFQKNLHGMQHGLLQVGHSLVELIEGTKCGFVAHTGLEKLRTQAERLQVLVSAGSLDSLDVNVKYEPMKALNVGGVDIHLELNRLIIAWQFNNGPEEMGRALEGLLRDFDDDKAEEVPEAASDKDAVATDTHEEKRTPKFWADVLQRAMERLGGGESGHMSEACLSSATARSYGDSLEDAIARMLEKTRRSMRAGIRQVAEATVAFVDGLETTCSETIGATRLRKAASRLQVFASAKSLIDAAKNVEYEPMKVLKVGGIDVHKELNRFLVAWINHQGAVPLADGLVDFFEDFKEHEVEETPASPSAGSTVDADIAKEPEMLAMLRDAMNPSRNDAENPSDVLPEACLPETTAETFAQDVEQALVHMLEKQTHSMQVGLKELAGATERLFTFMDELNLGCVSQGAVLMQQGAKKLTSLTQKTTVDYGTYIQYEALKGLVVGTVDIHLEINEFIGAWKLKSRREAGAGFGKLMRKLVAIKGHDEL